MWTQFFDMYSGGRQKEKWEMIYIEAHEEEAKLIFYNKFGHSPDRVTCTCCGEDYATRENEDLTQLTAYHRGCNFASSKDGKKWKYLEKDEKLPKGWKYSSLKSHTEYQTLEEYCKRDDILIIKKEDINSIDRLGEIPEEGYIWV